MKKVKISIVIFIQLLLSQSGYSQISKIRENINKLFFNTSISKERFDIKAILNSSENFYNIEEFDYAGITGISSGFEENPFMNKLGRQNKISIHFKGNGNFDQMIINSNYKTNEVKICQEQINSLNLIFKNLSYKSVNNSSYDGKNQMIGRGYSLYSTLSSFQKQKSYLSISYTQRNNDDYILDIHYFPNNLY